MSDNKQQTPEILHSDQKETIIDPSFYKSQLQTLLLSIPECKNRQEIIDSLGEDLFEYHESLYPTSPFKFPEQAKEEELENNIKTVQLNARCSRDAAIIALEKNNNNIVDAILSLY